MSEDKKQQPLKVEILDKMSMLIATSLGFVAAFSWNETFKVLLLSRLAEKDSPMVLVVYSLFVSILAVILIIVIARAAGKAKRALQ